MSASDLSNARHMYPKLKTQIIPDSWVLPNKLIFTDWLNTNFKKNPQDSQDDSCACLNDLCKSNKLFPQQKIVRDFFQLLSPYRGILLYHGLGVGKTCASIAIAEAMGNDRQIIFLSKASLEQNFRNELKFCGNDYYINHKNKWVFVKCDDTNCKSVSHKVGIPLDIINKNKGVWLIDTTSKEDNYKYLTTQEKQQIDNQIEHLINHKYEFMHYDATNLGIKILEKDNNPFDNKLLIVDEIHNITNSMAHGSSIARVLEERIFNAKNLRMVALTGTPLVNDIYEISKLFNLLRGPIETYIINTKISERIRKALMDDPSIDYVSIDKDKSKIVITHNPYGFIKEDDGVRKADINLNNKEFIKKLLKIFNNNGVKIKKHDINKKINTVLPDNQDIFYSYFYKVNDNELINTDLFSSRINGLVSYYRTAGKERMPRIKEEKIISVEMSEHQFKIYKNIRMAEFDKELKKKKPKKTSNRRRRLKQKSAKTDLNIFKVSDTYKSFSRMACSFVFPDEIIRPRRKQCKLITAFESTIINSYDEWKDIQKTNVQIGLELLEKSEIYEQIESNRLLMQFIEMKMDKLIVYVRNKAIIKKTYSDMKEYNLSLKKERNKRIDNYYSELKQYALTELVSKKDRLSGDNLQILSPKYHKVLENITGSPGNVFIYSEYRNLEGLGILSKVLDENGYAEFKVMKTADGWDINISDDDMGKLKYIKWGAQKEMDNILLKIFNNQFDEIKNKSPNLIAYLSGKNNLRGDIAKIFMTTKTGAEGITLKNVRQVNILEPYWNYGRMEQVRGRAIRACSHEMLDEAERDVSIYTYISVFSSGQDITGYDHENITTDQYLYNLSLKKKKIIDELFNLMKASAFDCNIHFEDNKDDDDQIKCSKHLDYYRNGYLYNPDIKSDYKDKKRKQRTKKKIKSSIETEFRPIKFPNMTQVFLLDEKTKTVHMDKDNDRMHIGDFVNKKFVPKKEFIPLLKSLVKK